MNLDPSQTTAQLVSHVEELDRIGDRFLQALELGDLSETQRWAIASRGARSRIADAREAFETIADRHSPDTVAMLAKLGQLAVRQRLCDQAFELWANRPLPDGESLLETPEGVATVAEQMIPLAWDYHSDLAVLIGADLGELEVALRAQGQRRVVGVVPPGVEHDYGSETIVVNDADELCAAIGRMMPRPPRRLVTKQHPRDPTTPEQHAELVEQAEQALIDARVHSNTVRSFGRVWIDQGLTNLPHVASSPSVASLTETFRNKPMVIVAPGPSLAKNIDRINELRGRAVIVTFSHTMAALSDAGVVPDLVMTVDPQDVRYHFEGAKLDGVAALVNGATVHPALYELGVKRHVSAAANTALDDWIYEPIGEDASLEAGGSVATSALAMGLRWGCNPIAFVGLDLSFADGKYYIDSSCDGDTEVAMSEDGEQFVVSGWSEDYRNLAQVQGATITPTQSVIKLPGYHGGHVPTSFMFSVFHRWFEGAAKRCAGTTRLVNCTEGGARIEGVEQMPLADFAAELPDIGLDVGQEIDRAVADLDIPGRRERVVEHLEVMLASTRRCVKLARRCHTLAKRASRSPKAMAPLERAERALMSALAPIGFISLPWQQQIGEAQRLAHQATTVEETLAASRALFRVLGATAEAFAEPLARAKQRLAARIEADAQ